MRLLLLTPQVPYPPHQGTTARNFNLIRNLAANHQISLICFGSADEVQAAKPLTEICKKIYHAPPPTRSLAQRALSTFFSIRPDMALRLRSPAMFHLVRRTMAGNTYDVVQVEGIEMAPYMVDAHRQPVGVKWVYDDHNAEYMLQRTASHVDWQQGGRWHKALYSAIQWRKLARYEGTVCRMADHVFVASRTDARAIEQLRVQNVTVLPNGVDTEYFRPSADVCAKPLAELGLVYAGKMDFRPNIDAMEWFCGEILPRVRAESPLAHLTIIGQKPTAAVKALGTRAGVQVTGWVPDTRPFVADTAVFIVPLRMGSGTRLKVLEAMAMGKAIVSTSLGMEGIDVVDGREVVIADSPAQFSRCVLELLRDPGRRQQLGSAARELALGYDWRRITPIAEATYQKLVPP